MISSLAFLRPRAMASTESVVRPLAVVLVDERIVSAAEAESARLEVGGAALVQNGVAPVAKPDPLLNLGIPRPTKCEPIDKLFDGTKALDEPKWIFLSTDDSIYEPKKGAGAIFDRAPGSRLASSAVAATNTMTLTTECQAAVAEKTAAASECAEEGDRGSATGWGSDAQGQWWGEGSEAMWEDPNCLTAVQSWSCHLQRTTPQYDAINMAEGADFSQGPDEDTPTLIAGYRRALSHALEAVSDAGSVTAKASDPSVQLQYCLRHVLESLEWVDQCPSYAAAALESIEKAVGLAGVDILEKMKFAECRVRDLVAWRVQLCAPMGNREMYLAAARLAWCNLGLVLNDRSMAKLLHAHRQEIARQIPAVFLSETQRQSRARGGKIRAARNRPEAGPPGPPGLQIFII